MTGEPHALLSRWHHTAEAAVWVDDCVQNVSSCKSDKMPKIRETSHYRNSDGSSLSASSPEDWSVLTIVSYCGQERNVVHWHDQAGGRSDITVQLISVWMRADVAAVADLAVWLNHHHRKYLNILGCSTLGYSCTTAMTSPIHLFFIIQVSYSL